MCLVAYIAARQALPVIGWDPAAPAFHVREDDAGIAQVRGHFRLPFVYYIGSHTGCGCGFNSLDANADAGQPESSHRTLAALGEYLRAAVAQAGPLELYTCWDRDEADPIEHHLTVGVNNFNADMQWFPERTHVTIVAEPSP